MTNGDLFESAIALITGANKGIGYETARGLGAKKIVVLIGARDAAKGEAAAAKMKAEGIDARPVPLDVTNKNSIAQAARWIEAQFGRLDILVNNAGIGEWGSRPSDADLAKVREVYDTNLFGPMAVTQAMLPLLRRSRRGRIVNVTSSLGSLQMATDSKSPISQFLALGYNTSKTALNSMTVQFANELRGYADQGERSLSGLLRHRHQQSQRPSHRSPGSRRVHSLRHPRRRRPTGGLFDENGPVAW